MTHNEDAIRERAYHLWEAAGRPHHREREFWEQAMREHAAAETNTNGHHAPKAALADIEPASKASEKSNPFKAAAPGGQTPPAPPGGGEATRTGSHAAEAPAAKAQAVQAARAQPKAAAPKPASPKGRGKRA